MSIEDTANNRIASLLARQEIKRKENRRKVKRKEKRKFVLFLLNLPDRAYLHSQHTSR